MRAEAHDGPFDAGARFLPEDLGGAGDGAHEVPRDLVSHISEAVVFVLNVHVDGRDARNEAGDDGARLRRDRTNP